ncbi:MAG: hypothetical protein HOP19_25820 [Acidobacteria bacterium]|nr:hypothetical protein [Acidobacteriota bacterium]
MSLDPNAERQLIEMYEAREAITRRINADAVRPNADLVLEIDRFLQASVTEIGQRLNVDRCDVITPSDGGGFRVSHEYHGDRSLPPGLGLNILLAVIPLETIKTYLPQARHYGIVGELFDLT